jgi:hypothetical protein
MDKIIDAIWLALRKPATTYEELAERVSTSMKERISASDISNALAYLRRNALEYGWTVPHVKRGAPVDGNAIEDDGDDGRYFRCLIDRDGTFFFDDDAAASAHFKRGAEATLNQIVTLSKNSVTMLQANIAHTRSTNQRAMLNDVLADFQYAARKSELVLLQWKKVGT